MIWFNNFIAHILPLVPKSLVKIFARQYLAGETLADAVAVIRDLNARKISATLDLLGEAPANRQDCVKAVDVYEKAIYTIEELKLDSGISLKPSHMGLTLDRSFCLDNIRKLAALAQKKNVFIRIDMEDAALKNDTIDLYVTLKQEFDNIGIVMQAYLRSAITDINQMIQNHANIRLCKGAYYWEDKQIVYKDMQIINSSYVYLLSKLLSNHCFTGIATHDEALVFEAMKIIDTLCLSKAHYEFQMLYGVAEGLRKIIHDQGHPIRVYVPFGKDWFAYSIRRLKENPKMINYIFSNALKTVFNR